MIYQLPNGNFIELSMEEFLSMDEQDLRDLNSLGNNHTTEYDNPFVDVFSSTKAVEYIEENEPELLDITDLEKLYDEDFIIPDD